MATLRRWPNSCILLALALWTLPARSQPAPPPSRPNILFILADDLGYGDLGCYGQKHIATPRIDALAAAGMRFTNFYAGNAVCAPSRCSLLTGLHPGHAFVRDNRELKTEGQLPLPANTATLATVLKSAGYRTACIGKWGLGGPGSTGEPTKLGFDHFLGYLCQRHAHRFYPDYLWRDAEKLPLPENADGKRVTYSHDLMTKEALDFVSAAKPNEPFFLYLAYTIPHFDLDVPEDSMKPYEGKWEEPNLPMGTYLPQPRPRAAYAGMISRMDRDVGRLLDLLKQKGLDDNTLVIFTSDNGATFLKGLDSKFFNSCGPLRGFKGDLYEGGIRVPFIARWPGKVAAGAVTDHVGAFWDIMPTIADLAGAKPPANTDGLSLVPTLTGNAGGKPHDYLYWEFPQKTGAQAVRLGNWKAVRPNAKTPDAPIELYDLATDPGEQTNLAPTRPDLIAQITAIMKTAHTDSPEFPLRNPPKAP